MTDASSDSAFDARSGLRHMQRAATGLFIAVSAIFVAARLAEVHVEDVGAWVGFVRAGAEAAMVGAIADWFAVTALFRHPLGLKIPHTAIIPERKSQIGEGLGTFVQTNFASGTILGDRVAAMQPARRLGEWLDRRESPELVGRFAAQGLRWCIGRLRDDEFEQALERFVLDRVTALDAGPALGRALGAVTAEGRHEQVVTDVLRTGVDLLDGAHDELWARFQTRAPWWVPGRVDASVFDRLFDAGRELLVAATADPRHALRQRLDARIAQFASDLQHDETLQERVGQWRDELVADEAVRAWVALSWKDAKQYLLAQADDPNSTLRLRLDRVVAQGAETLRTDTALQARIDAYVTRTVREWADDHGREVARLVSSTVERWDAHDAADRIELAVGRDLQYIRINGTIVGGLAGLVIHTASRLF